MNGHPKNRRSGTIILPFRRDVVVGAVAGLVGGLVLSWAWQKQGLSVPAGPIRWSTLGEGLIHLVSAMLGGAVFGALFPYQPESPAASISGGLLLGLLWWIVGPLTLGPVWMGHAPTWSTSEADAAFPSLIAYLLYGVMQGGGFYALGRLAARFWPLTSLSRSSGERAYTHVVILGGGFGGVSAAQRLEQLGNRHREIKVTLVSQSNYLLFTPMLAEVAGSELEPQHIGAPLRAALPHTDVRRGAVDEIDVENRTVRIRATPTALPDSLRYDHLLLALGSVPHYHGIAGLAAHAFPLKTLEDGLQLRDHVVTMLEAADAEPRADVRRRQLTLLVAGGGFAGTELIAELFDLVHGVRRFYPRIQASEPRFLLVHSGDRLLPELSPLLAEYARQKLSARGVEVHLNTRVVGATTNSALLSDGQSVSTHTLVWAAGNRPHPLLQTLPCERNRAGAAVATPTLQLNGHPTLWAVGDCAEIADQSNGGAACPPTAQHATRQGVVAAENIVASLTGRRLRPFRFRTIAVLVGLGHHSAVAEWRGQMFSGPLAWFMWRAVYLIKLPGLDKKMRVALDWSIDLLFPRDIVLTASAQRPGPPRPDARGSDAVERREPPTAERVAERIT